jgi:hypothetical protein
MVLLCTVNPAFVVATKLQFNSRIPVIDQDCHLLHLSHLLERLGLVFDQLHFEKPQP